MRLHLIKYLSSTAATGRFLFTCLSAYSGKTGYFLYSGVRHSFENILPLQQLYTTLHF